MRRTILLLLLEEESHLILKSLVRRHGRQWSQTDTKMAEDRREGRGQENLFGHLIFFVITVIGFSISAGHFPLSSLSENIN